MLKIFAFVVITFFAAFWASGGSFQSFKSNVNHWADANTQLTGGGPVAGDWGSG